MPNRTVTLQFLGDTKQLNAAMESAGLKAGATADTIGDRFDRGTSKAAGGFSKLGQTIEGVTGIPVAGVFDKIASKFDAADSKGQKLGKTMASIGGATALAGVAGAAAVGAASLHMADQFEVAQASLQTAIKNSGGNFDALKPKISATYGQLAKFGFNSTETAGALTTLTTATGSPTKALGLMQTAANLARLKHVSLADAAGVLAKTLGGSTKALVQMGINLDLGSGKLTKIHADTTKYNAAQAALADVEAKVADGRLKGAAAGDALSKAQDKVIDTQAQLKKDQTAGANIMDVLKNKTDGAATAYGKTLSGQMASAKAQVDNLGIKFGQFLAPMLQKAASALSSVIGWLQRNKPVAIALAVVVGGVLVAAITAWTVSMITAAAATIAAAAPILLVVAAVGLLVLAVVEIIKHWGAISAFFAKLWGDVKRYFDDAVQFVIGLFLKFTPEGLIISHWSQIVGFFASIFASVKSQISGDLDAIIGFFEAIPGRIADALGKGFSAFAGVGKSIVNSIISGLNAVIDTLDAGIGAISIFGFHPPSHIIPDIPHLRIGGNLAAGQSALIGEDGPELFTAGSSGHVTPANQTAAAVGGNRSVVVHAHTNADPHEIAAQVGWLLR